MILSEMNEVLNHSGDRCKVAAISFTLFERAWTMRGMENLLVDMISEPAFVTELFEAIGEHASQIVAATLELPFDIIHFVDDWGQQKGMIMGPALWRQFIRPVLSRLFRQVKDSGRFVSLHSCGDIQDVFPDLIDMGLDIYQTLQPEIYDISTVKRDYGSHLTFWGGISTQQDLPYIRPEDVENLVHNTIDVLGVNGGYIAAPTHAIPGDVPPENIVALVDAFRNQQSS